MTAGDVAVEFAARLASAVSLSYVLAWLTIRSESILPAAVSHAIYNIFVTDRSLATRNPLWLNVALWAVAGVALFHFFPPPSPSTVAESDLPPAPEPQPSEV